MLFYIYIATIAFFYLGLTVFAIDTRYKVKQLGLKKYKSKNSNVRNVVQMIILSLIPIVNVFFGLLYVFSKRIENIADDQINKIKTEQDVSDD